MVTTESLSNEVASSISVILSSDQGESWQRFFRIIMNWRNSWARGADRNGLLMRSGFGKVFLAKDKESSSLVAIKVVQYAPDLPSPEMESELLRNCTSLFVVRHYGIQRHGSELWVALTEWREWRRL